MMGRASIGKQGRHIGNLLIPSASACFPSCPSSANHRRDAVTTVFQVFDNRLEAIGHSRCRRAQREPRPSRLRDRVRDGQPQAASLGRGSPPLEWLNQTRERVRGHEELRRLAGTRRLTTLTTALSSPAEKTYVQERLLADAVTRKCARPKTAVTRRSPAGATTRPENPQMSLALRKAGSAPDRSREYRHPAMPSP
ncbi:hypothetical protein SAMN06295900_11063 [Trinickia caryophylli]|uniref:Uncharacterized protein n=1 Tax=Trinickia caryophylli TaxID=28094 RepID=A0A1X7FN72_TRICW|nr:hypothetical protein SAMN06295900_11063 [Trinickia caryophylli]